LGTSVARNRQRSRASKPAYFGQRIAWTVCCHPPRSPRIDRSKTLILQAGLVEISGHRTKTN
jgi:hypothetical protein